MEAGNDAICGGSRNGVPVWEEQLQQAELAAIEAEVERDHLNMQMEKESKRRRDITRALQAAQKEVGSSDGKHDLEKSRRDLEQTEKRVAEIEAGLQQCEATMRRLGVLRRKNELLSSNVEEAVMKRVTFWQNAINYLLYVVFVCNAFIAIFGMTLGNNGAATSGFVA